MWDVLLAESDPDFILYVLGAVVVSSRVRLLACGSLDQAFTAMATAAPVDVWRLIHHARALHSLARQPH